MLGPEYDSQLQGLAAEALTPLSIGSPGVDQAVPQEAAALPCTRQSLTVPWAVLPAINPRAKATSGPSGQCQVGSPVFLIFPGV